MRRTKGHWTGLFVAVGLTLCCYAQDAPQTSQPPAPTHQDAPAPEPHPELKPLVEDIRTLLGNGKFQDALPKADELLQQAKAKSDKIGEAYALRFRAFALQEMRKTTPDQLPEVASVWASALALWREIGDEAFQVEALLGQAYCVWRASPEQAQALVAEALRVARGEAKRPLAVATALHNAGVDWYGIGQLSVAGDALAAGVGDRGANNSPPTRCRWQARSTIWGMWLFSWRLGACGAVVQQALAIFEKLAPNSLQVASTLHNLGNVAYSRGDLARAEQYYQQALAIREKLAPNSLQVAARSTIWEMWLMIVATWRVRSSLSAGVGDTKKLAPNSLDVADTLNNLGNVAYSRGDLARAEQYVSAGVGDLRKTRPQLAAGGKHAQQSGKCGC
jgi:tetratricopeptide (TPR) repeat protein